MNGEFKAYAVVRKYEDDEMVMGVFMDIDSAIEYLDDLVNATWRWKNPLIKGNKIYEIYEVKIEFSKIIKRVEIYK